ncbi:hypothetical protein CEXT_180761 [Caerostris extrusa]|uniref:Uncharacterized protein n=1 Tax=Caerostris extrusa TaxID=172846 RepID=A0AAV4MC09_CAEEX|nr:hypothetical protein CEXT_180761 [Caerostris extrusa]
MCFIPVPGRLRLLPERRRQIPLHIRDRLHLPGPLSGGDDGQQRVRLHPPAGPRRAGRTAGYQPVATADRRLQPRVGGLGRGVLLFPPPPPHSIDHVSNILFHPFHAQRIHSSRKHTDALGGTATVENILYFS